MKQKTISGARAKKGQKSNGCNPRHNNRDYLPSNADPARQHLNVFYAETTQSLSIEYVYEILFQSSYEEWLRKEQAKGRQKHAPKKYIDKVRQAKDGKREQYEIIWQIGDRNNTGWNSDKQDFERARLLLHDFANHLKELPNVAVVSPELLADGWQPPFDNGLVITNMALHGDENTPQIHMDFIPYTRTKTRGQGIQNAYAAAFEGMGYPVLEEQAVDELTGELLFKRDKNGELLTDKNGNPVPVMKKVAFGSIDWIEEQKGWIEEQMRRRYSWEREYKGRNPFGDVVLSEFAVEDNKRILAEQKQEIAQVKEKGKQLIEKLVPLSKIETLMEYNAEVKSLDATIQEIEEDTTQFLSEERQKGTDSNTLQRLLEVLQRTIHRCSSELYERIRQLKLFETLHTMIQSHADRLRSRLENVIETAQKKSEKPQVPGQDNPTDPGNR